VTNMSGIDCCLPADYFIISCLSKQVVASQSYCSWCALITILMLVGKSHGKRRLKITLAQIK
jgi:hypothetical protein